MALFPSENTNPTPVSLNPTVFSVGRPVAGASPSSFLTTDANGNLVTSFLTTGVYQPIDATLTALAGLDSSAGAVFQLGADSFVKKSFLGTTNQVAITETGSSLTFSTPQNIDTGATPGFYGLTLNGITSPTGKALYLDATGRVSAGNNFILSGNQLQLSGQSSTGGVLIGGDAQIYRSGADTLRTPDSWLIDGSLAVGQTSTTSKATIAQTDGVNYALTVRHTGGTITRPALFVETTGTASSTIALKVQTGGNTDTMTVDGAGMTGLGIIPSGNHRLQIKGHANTSATDAIRVTNSDATSILQLANNGYLSLGGTSSVAKINIVNTQTNVAIGGLLATTTFTGTDATSRTNYGVAGTYTGSTGISASHVGFGGQFVCFPNVASGASNSGDNGGIVINASINSASHAGTQTNLYGGYFRHGATSAATGGGIITNSWGLYVLTDFTKPTSFTITNSYGLQIVGTGSTSYPTNVWGVYEGYATSIGARNFFQNPVMIGTSATPVNFLVARNNSGAAWGVNGINARFGSANFTDTSTASSTTVALNIINSFGGGVLAATNSAVTYTNAVNTYISGPPVAGTNVTLTNPWALWVNTGHCRMGGNLYVGGTVDATYGNANLMGGATAVGVQIRSSNPAIAPTQEFMMYSSAVADNASVGRTAYWVLNNEVARIDVKQNGTAENAADILFSTATGGTLTERLRVQSTGRTVVQSLNVPTATTPASATATGTTGDICWDANYIYVATGTNTWKRAALATW